MKIDFTVNDCQNPAVVWAIKGALERAGFKVQGCGVMLSTGEADIECSPPVDFIDELPDAFVPIMVPAGGSISFSIPPGMAAATPRPWWKFW